MAALSHTFPERLIEQVDAIVGDRSRWNCSLLVYWLPRTPLLFVKRRFV